MKVGNLIVGVLLVLLVIALAVVSFFWTPFDVCLLYTSDAADE